MAHRSSTLDKSKKTNIAAIYTHFSLRELADAAESRPEIFENTIDLKWIKNYCNAKKIPLFLPLMPHIDINESIEHRRQYYADLVKGLYHYYEAMKLKNEIKDPQNKSDPAHTKEETLTLQSNYKYHLRKSDDCQNYLAAYQIMLDRVIYDTNLKSATDCITRFKVEEEKNLSVLSNVGIAGLLFKADFYYRFASFLHTKPCFNEIKTSALFNPAHLDTDTINAFRESCLTRSAAALDEFEQSLKGLAYYTFDPLTTSGILLYWGNNKPDVRVRDVIDDMRLRLKELHLQNPITLSPH